MNLILFQLKNIIYALVLRIRTGSTFIPIIIPKSKNYIVMKSCKN